TRTEESQSSQLLAAALRPREVQATVQPASTEASRVEGSLSSGGNNSIHYHLNGLLPTQTQSLYSSQEPALDEGSQKENAPSSSERSKGSPDRELRIASPRRVQAGPTYPSPPAERPPSARGSKDRSCPKDLSFSNQTPLPSKDDNAPSLASPLLSTSGLHTDRAAIAPVRAMPPPRRPRSPPLASQDSFAGPLCEQDPAKAYMAQTRDFHIPLSQIGRDYQSASEGEDGPPPISSSMWGNQSRRRSSLTSSSTGKVLVEGTPSSSSRSNGSQSQSGTHRPQGHYAASQDSANGTQLSDLFPAGQGQSVEAELADLEDHFPPPIDTDDTHDQDDKKLSLSPRSQSDATTEPSSSYERLVNQDPFSPVIQATQPAHPTMDETQPVDYSTQSHPDDVPTLVREHDFHNRRGQIVFPSIPSTRTSDTTRSTIPRGLLGLVAPHKRYRYQDVTSATSGPSTQQVTGTARDEPSHWIGGTDETQSSNASVPAIPTDVAETQPSHPSVANQGVLSTDIPKRMLPTATHALQTLQARRRSPGMEIVPDSEETRLVPDSDPPNPFPQSPSADASTAPSSPFKPRPRKGLQSEDEVLHTVTMEATAPSIEPIPEDDEEDVPLATTLRSAVINGKQKAAGSSTVGSPLAKGKPLTSPRKADRTDLIYKGDSWRDAVVPSSDPQEQREDAAVQGKGAKEPKTLVRPAGQPPLRSRGTQRRAKLAANERLHETSDEDKDVVIPDQEDDDEDTQPAEDDMDVDPPDATMKPARALKRKRTVSSARKTAAKGGVAKAVKEESSTPLTRPNKRLKSASARTASASGSHTRVFALWKQDGHYYSGTVHSIIAPGRYDVHFDDGDSAITELKHMRLCCLRNGDNVLWHDKVRAVVVSAPTCGSAGHTADDNITLDLDLDGEETTQVASVRLAPRTVRSEWSDRMLCDDAISPVIKPKSRSSPTPSRLSVPSEGSVRGAGRKPLTKTGLVVTLSPKNTAEKERDCLMTDIRRNGGIVLDDWTALFGMEGTVSQKGQRWRLKAEDLQWKGRTDVERAFLISDDNHQKAKFLIALALGIPCLSVGWLRDVVKEQRDLDWQPYLLPAGFSEHFETRVSQLVDLDWGNSIHHLSDISANSVPSKVFMGMSMLCISPLFVPSRGRGKKNNNGGNQAAESVPQIILCMGAGAVEAVTDEKHASLGVSEYDLIVVREQADRVRLAHLERCVDVNWVKDCLISGRLLPIPQRN
ncbi:hypothetical protein BD413DRAFT_463455, partial [Trametes elegans]